MYEFKYDYGKPKHREQAKSLYMNTGSFIAYIKTVYIYLDIAKDVEIWFDTSNYEWERALPKKKLSNW